MRKVKEQSKNTLDEQQRLFDAKGQPLGDGDGGTIARSETGIELTSRLEEQRSLTKNILDEIVEYKNLDKAYRQVRDKGGSSGIDKMDTDELRDWLGHNIKTLREDILSGKYEPMAVRKVDIPKPNGGTRMLGIPTVKDRLIQQAIHQVLNRWYEPHFHEHSYGFRPKRNAKQAILRASAYVSEGKEWVVDIDLEKFFDKINHDRLMQRLSKGIGDKRLLRLVNAYLQTGIMTGGMTEQRLSGTPQGSPISPLLSNIVLDELDRELEKRGLSFCRYADDCNIFVGSRKAGERVLSSITQFIEKKLKLKVNRGKSGVRHCSKVKFLGYTVMPEGKIRVADKSIERLKMKIRSLTNRNRGVRMDLVIKELNEVIVGWSNYYSLANTWLSNFRNIDGWIRRKLRCYRLKQCGRKYTIYKLLRSFDLPINLSWNVVMYSQGWWNMSNKIPVKVAMSPLWFASKGLVSLEVRMTG
jgi:group II intron reverse transcriptase/maturase